MTEKNWKVDGYNTKFTTLDLALDKAKRAAAGGTDAYGVYELVATAQAKVPDVDVNYLK